MNELPRDRNLCLNGVKSEAFLVILKILTFIGTVLYAVHYCSKHFEHTDCKGISPIHLIYHCHYIAGLPNTIQNNIAQRDDRPATANLNTC